MTHVIIAHAAAAPRARRIRFGIAVVMSLPAVWLRRIRARRELMSLLSQPDYIIKDVGLQRHDITHEGMKPFWRP